VVVVLGFELRASCLLNYILKRLTDIKIPTYRMERSTPKNHAKSIYKQKYDKGNFFPGL
jgi:hypothetical protein